jgi:hypothetical protein
MEPQKMRRKDPNQYSGGYLLHLYCDQEGCYGGASISNSERGFIEVGDQHTKAGALRVARQIGWKVHKDGTATCPYCLMVLVARKRNAK